jgi:glycosyltransferase involved in cell wall biosynthesis
MNAPSILHFITDLRCGGEAKLLLSFLPEFERAGMRNTVCCLAPILGAQTTTETNLIPDFEKAGIPVVSLNATRATMPIAIVRLFALLRRHRPDILHTYLFHPNILGRVLGRTAGIPIVVSSVVSVDDWKRHHHVLLERYTAPLADKILVNAKAVRERLITRDRISKTRVSLSYNGVKIEDFESVNSTFRQEQKINQSTKIIGAVCRLHKAKALDKLLFAFANLSRLLKDVVLVIVGDGPERNNLTLLADRLGISDRILWTGVRYDVPALMKDFDVFVISSAWEGLPGTLFEAMAARVPIVATRVGGIPEVIQNRVNGILVEPNAEDELTRSIKYLLETPEFGRQLVARAAIDVQTKFIFTRAVRERLSWYRKLLKIKTHDNTADAT